MTRRRAPAGGAARTARFDEPPLTVNGWTLFAHPLFLDQVETLAAQVERLKARDPVGYRDRNAAKRLAAIVTLALEVIPQDPTRAQYRQGAALGPALRHWFRAKFFQQYRLFFRFHLASRVIVYAWVNDEDTKRAYESADDVSTHAGRRAAARRLGQPPGGSESGAAAAEACGAGLKRPAGFHHSILIFASLVIFSYLARSAFMTSM